jgi:hypothetical protein
MQQDQERLRLKGDSNNSLSTTGVLKIAALSYADYWLPKAFLEGVYHGHPAKTGFR